MAKPHRRNGQTNRHTQPSGRPRRKMVLVYEDHASVGGLIAGLVRQDGYRTARAWDANEAIRMARGRAPDAIVLDLSLAYPEGLAPLHALRGHEATSHSPIVLVSANGPIPEGDLALADEFITKPFDIDVMLNAVRKALGDPEVEVAPRVFEAQDYFLNGY